MLLNFLWIYFFVGAAIAEGNFIILHNPNSVKFSVNGKVDQSFLKEIFSASLGFTVKQKDWNGISIQNAYGLPEAIVSIVIEGVDSLNSTGVISFPLNDDEIEETTWQVLSARFGERNKDKRVRFYLGDGLNALGESALGALKPRPVDQSSLQALSLNNEEDKKFLDQVELLRAIAKKITSTKHEHSKSDLYWFVVPGLIPVINSHGKGSPPALEAFSLLTKVLDEVSKSFVNMYSGKVLITAFTNNATKFRDTRSILNRVYRDVNMKDAVKIDDMNLAKKYDENYPIIFNIILWFGVTFFFSLLAICIAIASMDPGRDSIIYRMTSNRMKKEN